jgi:hypothetical protein
MNWIVSRVILCCITLMLFSCSAYKNFMEIQHAKAECHHTCQDKLSKCLVVCHNNKRDCSVSAHLHAGRQYGKYLNEQSIQGKDQILELNSFRDPLQCQKTTCECLADARVCRQFCDGKIRKRFQVVPPPC